MDEIILLVLFLFAILIGYYIAMYRCYYYNKEDVIDNKDLEIQELKNLINSITQSV